MADTVSSESVAQDQLSQFFTSIESPENRFRYVMDRMTHCRGISEFAINRAIKLAGQVLGVEFQVARHLTQLGFLDANVPFERIGPLPLSVVGYVYLGRVDGQPNLVKVGFSREPNRRQRELAIGGPGFRIVRTFIGTMLDEHAVHCDRRALRVEGEWFRARAA